MSDEATVPELGQVCDRGRTIFIVSDGTGRTSEQVIRAALTQFATSRAVLVRRPGVRTEEELAQILNEAVRTRGLIIHTIVSLELRQKLARLGLSRGVPIIDVLGPVLTRLQDLLEISPLAQPGLFRHLDDDYYNRIAAIDYTVKHDDGLDPEGMTRADIVLVGVSRTCKTPLSIYLAYRGFAVANVPIIDGVEPPRQLFEVDNRKVVGLTVHPRRLQSIRDDRLGRYGPKMAVGYSDLSQIERELNYAKIYFRRGGWPVLDVTAKAIEEAATDIMNIIGHRPESNETVS